MAEQAKVTSVEVLESFRASLIVFLTKARRSMDEVRDAIRRTKQWLDHDQKEHWETQIRLRRRKLDQATQELFSARLSDFTEKTPRQVAVRKCKAALEEAEEKYRATKKWNQNFEAAADPMNKKLESLRQFLDDDLPKAVTYLSQAQRTLEDYAGVHAPVSATPVAAPPPESETEAQP